MLHFTLNFLAVSDNAIHCYYISIKPPLSNLEFKQKCSRLRFAKSIFDFEHEKLVSIISVFCPYCIVRIRYVRIVQDNQSSKLIMIKSHINNHVSP